MGVIDILDQLDGTDPKYMTNGREFPTQSIRLQPHLSFQYDLIGSYHELLGIDKYEVYNSLLAYHYGQDISKYPLVKKYGAKLHSPIAQKPLYRYFTLVKAKDAVQVSVKPPGWVWKVSPYSLGYISAGRNIGHNRYHLAFSLIVKQYR